MQPPSKLKSWANEDSLLASEVVPLEDPVGTITGPDGDSDGEYQVITKKSKPSQDTKTSSTEQPAVPTPVIKAGKSADEVLDMEDVAHELPQVVTGDSGPVSDADWLRSRTNRVLDLVEDAEGPTRTVTQPPAVQEETMESPDIEVEPAEPSQPENNEVEEAIPSEEDKIRQTGRLYLRNLHFEITEDDIRNHFSKQGSLEEVRTFSRTCIAPHSL